VEAHARYKASARYDDWIAGHPRVGDVGPKVITFQSQVYRQADGRLLAEGHIKVVLTTAEGRAGTLPPALVAWLRGDEPFDAQAPASAGHGPADHAPPAGG